MTLPRIFILLLFFVAIGLAQDVRYNYARDVHFPNYHNYTWVAITDAVQLGQLAEQQLKSALDAEVSRKAIGLSIYDAGKEQLIWRAEANKTINPKATPDKVQKNLDEAVTKLIKNYLPPVKNKSSG